jgi:hypothetical protein
MCKGRGGFFNRPLVMVAEMNDPRSKFATHGVKQAVVIRGCPLFVSKADMAG